VYDSHCHLDHSRFDDDRDAVIARARAAGVTGMLLAGVDAEGRARQVALADAVAGLRVSFGVHPMVVAELDDAGVDVELDRLRADLAVRRPAAIGETGLDRRSILPRDSLPRQERAFRAQLRLARDHGLPVVLHVVRAHELALRALREERVSEVGGVVHSYSGPAELVPAYLGLGLHLSMCGTVTFPDARRARAAAAIVPLDRLLVETDAPDQAPEPHRASRNEPGLLGRVVETIAALRGDDPSALARVTAENARRLYGG
jgi:TatD DNase family protein